MNKLLFLTVIFAFASIASFGFLGINFDIIAQALGVFDKDTAVLIGCDCFDSAGNTVDCDDANVEVTSFPLCPDSPSQVP